MELILAGMSSATMAAVFGVCGAVRAGCAGAYARGVRGLYARGAADQPQQP
jgi:hypothetical protein